MLNPLIIIKVAFFYTFCFSKESAYYWWKSIGFRILGFFQIYEKRHYRFLSRQLSEGSTAIDIGAHFGIYSSLFLDRVGENGKVFLFEPFPPAFNLLSSRFKAHKNCCCLPYAISNQDRANFWLSIPKLCGIVPEPALAEVSDHKKNDSDYAIETRTLDSFQADLVSISLIKADVEGHEIKMLEGALQCISKFRPLIMFEDNNIANNIKIYSDMLAPLNYHLCFLDKFSKLQKLESNDIPNDYNFYLVPVERMEALN